MIIGKLLPAHVEVSTSFCYYIYGCLAYYAGVTMHLINPSILISEMLLPCME